MTHRLTTWSFLLFLLLLPSTAFAAMPWIISADAGSKHVADGALLLDARSTWSYTKGHLEGAVHADWTEFTPDSKTNRGRLIASDKKLAKILVKHGVQDGRRVVVVDDAKDGWGEAGRIVWMLRTLGHEDAAWVDGGHQAMVKRGHETTIVPVKAPKSAGFTIKRTNKFAVNKAKVKQAIGSNIVFVDTREEREFNGKTPYGEKRGGHLPGAKHLWFRDLVQPDGTLKPRKEIVAILNARGITEDQTIVAYCTGGVRSGWFTGVLQHFGFKNAANYAGSMWEWSAEPADSHPLEQ